MILIIKHISIEGPGTIGQFFSNSDYEIKTFELDKDGILPRDFSQVEAVIILGGPMNVYEEKRYPFLKEESRFLKKAVDLEIPVLGICLGAQMIAKAFGVKVKKANEKEIGWYKIYLTEQGLQDPLFEGLAKEEEFFQWHEDQFQVPRNSLLLAESGVCPQAFRVGRNAYGLQFHFEVIPEMIETWIQEYLAENEHDNGINARHILLDSYRKGDELLKKSNRILLNFTRIIELSRKQKN